MIKELNLSPIIIFYSYLYEHNKNYKIIDKIKELFVFDWDIKINDSTKILSFQSLNREDYNNFIDLVLSTVKPFSSQHVLLKKAKRINIKTTFFSLKNIFYIYKRLNNIKESNKKFYIFISILDILKILDKFKDSKPKFIITHADMQPIENLIIQYFKSKNIPTVTLQHGLYIDYTEFPNINEVNYKNVVSDYFLSWGEETKILLQKYQKNININIVGNPTISETLPISANFFVIIFEQELLKSYNYILLDIGRKIEKYFNIKFKVKFHPRNTFKDYNIARDEVVKFDTVFNAKFVIGHTSTMMYQMMRCGIPTFKLYSNIPSNLISDKLVFHDFEDLKKLIMEYKNIDFKTQGEFYIKYIDKISLQKYKSFFQELL